LELSNIRRNNFSKEELEYIRKLCFELEIKGLRTYFESSFCGMYAKSQAMVCDGGKAYDEKGRLKAEYTWTDKEKESILYYYPNDDFRLHTK